MVNNDLFLWPLSQCDMFELFKYLKSFFFLQDFEHTKKCEEEAEEKKREKEENKK